MKTLNQYDPLEIIDMSNIKTLKRKNNEFIDAIGDLVDDSKKRFGINIFVRHGKTKEELNSILWEVADQYIKNEIEFSV